MWHGMYIFEDALPGFDSHGLSNYNPEIHNPMPDCPFCRKNFTRDELFIQCRRCSRPTHKACSIKLETSLLNNFSVTCGPCIVERSKFWHKPEFTSPSKRMKKEEEACTPQCPSIETIKLLLELGAEVNGINYQKETPLHSAVKANSYEAVKTLLDAGAKVKRIECRSRPILHIAALNSRVEIVKLLIDHGAPLDEKDCIGQSPIFMAAQSGNVAVLKYLCEGKADKLEAKTFDGRTLLHRTVWHGHIEATKWLLDHGMNPNDANRKGWTPLHNAAALGRIDIASILLCYGAKIDSKTEDLETPYSVAKCYNHIPFMEFLQSKGAVLYNIRYKPEDDSPSNRKNTYTSSQTESQHSQCPSIETMKLLLELGAEVNGINYQQETPLHSAVKANSYEAVKNLLDAGAKISNIFYRSQKILHIAARNSRVEIVKLLIDHGAPVDEKDCIGQSPIFMAAQSGNVAVLEYLYEKRPDELAVKTFDKRTLLHRTVWHGHIEATKWLLDHYMNPNVASRSGWTPLHNAAALGRIDIAKILLRYGAKIDSKTEHLDTPYSVAKCYNRIPFMEFLQSKGAVV